MQEKIMQKNYQHLWRVERDANLIREGINALKLKYWNKEDDTTWQDKLVLNYKVDGKFLKWLEWAICYVLCFYQEYRDVVMSKIQDKEVMGKLIAAYQEEDEDLEKFLIELSKEA